MKRGKAFEIFVKRILINVGFSEVVSDGLYIFDGAPGQMIQGLGEAHNADALLEPPVQTPFYARTRLLIECKDYSRKVGLNTVRSVLGLREDINHFDIVDVNELVSRRTQKRRRLTYHYERYSYQVAIAAFSGYTNQAQKFAATYRIPLLEFDRMPFWSDFCEAIRLGSFQEGSHCVYEEVELRDPAIEKRVMESWLSNASNELEVKKQAINCKANFLSSMIVYYAEYGLPVIKMISIDKNELKRAKRQL